VASAAEAARSAKMAMVGGSGIGLGSAQVGVTSVTAMRSSNSHSGRRVRPVGAFAPESPAALMAAARASNRTVEEVWEETLLGWLGGGDVTRALRPAPQVLERRQHVWHEIDSTLGALRTG
jgi:hypothetical protein